MTRIRENLNSLTHNNKESLEMLLNDFGLENNIKAKEIMKLYDELGYSLTHKKIMKLYDEVYLNKPTFEQVVKRLRRKSIQCA